MIPPLVALGASALPSVWNWVTGEKAPNTIVAVANAVADITGTTDPEAAKEILLNPEKITELRVRLAEITAQAERDQREATLSELKAEMADTANARDANLKLVQAGSSMSWAAPIVSVIITVGYFLAIYGLFFTPPGMDERVASLLNVLFGSLTIAFGQVVNYWLGSSAGSKRNGESIRAVAESVASKR